ncbi:hypothetical protein HDF19_12005 [Mucilaginibacter sp. E4BP6]|uniref:hypothetical protein n=1 Tax=Mucilaginibacter sp. E4BP6 TaxID=2723089 RepID=UPI0015CED703|nr:hypothetical protein [Mucilaginibacter sp. E4BP6]NYE65113.1 hypothetical protein [Mucilaginibacter sp. E4BP6]
MTKDELEKQLEYLQNEIARHERQAPTIENIKATSIVYRGKIIDAVSSLDRLLDIYIATYFCDSLDKVKEFSNIILGANRISLDGKRKLFDVLIKIQRPEFGKKVHRSFKKDMNTVMYERNSFAHNLVCTNQDAIDRATTHIGLQKFSANSRIEWYDEEKINSILMTIKKCSTVIIRMTQSRVVVLRPPHYEPKSDSMGS